MICERIAWRALCAVLLLACACGPKPGPARPAHAEAGAHGGHLLLVGGGKKPDAVMDLFVELGGGSEGRFVVLPLASGDSRDTGDYYVKLLRKHGARDVRVVHIDDRRDASRQELAEAVRGATGVWFAGGDQRRIAARIVDTPVHAALHAMRAAGGVVGGTSAGTACQSEIMLTGDGDYTRITRGNIKVTRGLGLLRDVVIDQHFVARKRNNRLIAVVLENPSKIGVGVDEATAAWFRPDGSVQAVGDGWIIVYDATGAEVVEAGEGRLGAIGMRQHVLAPGQRFPLQARTPASARELAPAARSQSPEAAQQPAQQPAAEQPAILPATIGEGQGTDQ